MLPTSLVARLRVAALALAFVAAAAPAFAVSTHDLVELSKAGLSDEVLVALVESDATVYNLDGPQIIELRRQGLSERVILAMIRNGQRAAAAAPPATAVPDPLLEPPPPLVVIETPEPAPVIEQTSVIFVPIVPALRPRHPAPRPVAQPRQSGYRGFGRFINDGWVEGRPPSGAR